MLALGVGDRDAVPAPARPQRGIDELQAAALVKEALTRASGNLTATLPRMVPSPNRGARLPVACWWKQRRRP